MKRTQKERRRIEGMIEGMKGAMTKIGPVRGRARFNDYGRAKSRARWSVGWLGSSPERDTVAVTATLPIYAAAKNDAVAWVQVSGAASDASFHLTGPQAREMATVLLDLAAATEEIMEEQRELEA